MHHIFIISYSTFSLYLWFTGSLIHGLEIRPDCHRHENISILYLYIYLHLTYLYLKHIYTYNYAPPFIILIYIINIHHSRMGKDYPAPFAFFSAYFVFQKKSRSSYFLYCCSSPCLFKKFKKHSTPPPNCCTFFGRLPFTEDTSKKSPVFVFPVIIKLSLP